MDTTNEIKRARQKMEILDTEGANQLLFDFLEFMATVDDVDYGAFTEQGKIWLIREFRKNYSVFLEENKPKDAKQTTLF